MSPISAPAGGLPAARAWAAALDAADPLAAARARFLVPSGVVYLDGNSLGPLPVGVRDAVASTLDRWQTGLISGWEDGWWDAPQRVGERIGRLIGAAPGQTVAGDSTSVQLFNALVAAARLRDDRTMLIADADGFPTDRYLAASVSRILGLTHHEVPMSDLADAIRADADEVAVVAASAVDFRTGERWDIPVLSAAAHDAGASIVWDLCHAAGALPLAVDADGVDFAVGCGYKYLSGGPGAPAFLYVAARHHAGFDQPLTGWHGHARPFDMAGAYEPADGIVQARIGTPPVLSLLALDAALDAFDGVTTADLRAKSLSLTDLFIGVADDWLASLGFEVVTPRDHDRRGSQVTLRHQHAEKIMAELATCGVIGDVRPPNLLRFGFNALYVSHLDVVEAVATIRNLCG